MEEGPSAKRMKLVEAPVSPDTVEKIHSTEVNIQEQKSDILTQPAEPETHLICQAQSACDDTTNGTSSSAESKQDPMSTDSSYGHVLKEKDVGITEYIGNHTGFSGVIKQRYSDFLVNEISLDGKIVQLTDISTPACDIQKTVTLSCLDVLPDDKVKELETLHEEKDRSKEVLLEGGEEKEKRSLIHKAIRQTFPQLESSTEDSHDGKRLIKVVYRPTKERQQRSSWPKDRGHYCRCVLYKENKDTMDTINLIAKFTRIKPGAFTYAGTKDRRAKTSQEISVFKVPASKLFDLNKRLRNITLGNFRYCKEAMKLGDLKGNHFVILLRNVTGTSDQIAQAMSCLQDVGFINYFGMQRFGTTCIPTHHIGRAILQSNWQEAVELILKPRGGEYDEVVRARQVWWETRDAAKALSILAKRPCIEKFLLLGLDKSDKNDLVGALGMIARNTRLMYVHSYQSYVWNCLVSHRLQLYGLKPVLGDLVIEGDLVEHSRDEESDRSSKSKSVPCVVTEDNLSQFSIQDVVMPLPGYDVMYPENSCGQQYTDMLAKDGLTTDMRHKVRDYSLPGGYRKMLVKPGEVSHQELHYDDVTEPLLYSDWDVLNNVQQTPTTQDGKLKALRLEFSLPSSTYATMAIREVLKSDTSAAHQATLNIS